MLMDLEYQSVVFDGECGVCGHSKLELRRIVHHAQKFELVVVVCPNCGHRDASIVDVGGGHPVRQVVSVCEASDLNRLVYRSPEADVFIPELGLELYHTAYTQPRITTIEGFLLEVKEKAESLFDEGESAEFLAKLDQALRGDLKLTFILVDESGSSWIMDTSSRAPIKP